MQQQDLLPHLFRTEFSKIVAVLVKKYGMSKLEMAEDVASETFMAALETWPFNGIPSNPVAWLYTVAKNKTINQLKRDKLFNDKLAEKIATPKLESLEIDLSENNIKDSQLQMMFAICHPSIPKEAQIGLALRLLCGFGIDEIANAFLTNKEVTNKRLYRAKKKLRLENVQLKLPAKLQINDRLDAVLATLYLLFNEGYYSESKDKIIHKELCLEAIRLTYMLIDNKQTNTPKVNALLALMCFQASRLESRESKTGEMILYDDQDEHLWNQELISKGMYFLNQSAQGNHISKYHLEATIAYWHTNKTDSNEKWETVLKLYNQLIEIENSPVAALNRIYALSKVQGNETAIKEAKKINIGLNRFYFALLGELYKNLDKEQSILNFNIALSLAKTKSEKEIINNKLKVLYNSEEQ